nr:TPA_asm: ATP synthase F0 subunit 8 [Cyathermia naticoides]
MPHLAPINWLIIWLFIWTTFLIFSIVMWWNFKPFYSAPLLTTPENQKSSTSWNW